MIQSMTGYGKATVAFGEKKIHVELKSLNSKAMDLSVRIARFIARRRWKSALKSPRHSKEARWISAFG